MFILARPRLEHETGGPTLKRTRVLNRLSGPEFYQGKENKEAETTNGVEDQRKISSETNGLLSQWSQILEEDGSGTKAGPDIRGRREFNMNYPQNELTESERIFSR